MKLRDYLSKKTLKRKFSRLSLSRQPEVKYTVSTRLVEYQVEPRAIHTIDDCYIPGPVPSNDVNMRVKSPGNSSRRDPRMTQSLFTGSAGYYSGGSEGSLTSDVGCQAPADNAACGHNDSYSPDIAVCDTENAVSSNDLVCTPSIDSMSGSCNNSCCCYKDQHFRSLPSIQLSASTPLLAGNDKQYHSLPSSMMQSVYVRNAKCQEHIDTASCRNRSRIRTNPWLPLPNTPAKQLPKRGTTREKSQPRLSRLFSEVEEIMREQCAINEATSDNSTVSNGSRRSLASACSSSSTTCSQPHERILSDNCSLAYGGKCNLVSENFSLSSDTPDKESQLNSSSLTASHHRPAIKDFTASLLRLSATNLTKQELSDSVSPLMSESMFNSTVSVRSEALQERVRRLCQSTADLDEKMRLARLESSYIQVK